MDVEVITQQWIQKLGNDSDKEPVRPSFKARVVYSQPR